MFHPLPLYIGLRYVRSRGRGFFVSFISWISMAGICVGVMALIAIISVMNGFERENRARLLSLSAHATLTGDSERMRDWASLAKQARVSPGVIGVAPFTDLQGMVGRGQGQELHPALIRGVEPELEPDVSEIDRHMRLGTLQDLQPGEQRIILGIGLAYSLNAKVGDEIMVLVPIKVAPGQGMLEGIDLQPKYQNFTVSGIFEAGVQENDNFLALIDLRDAGAFTGHDATPAGLRLKFADVFAAPLLAPQVASNLGGGLAVSDWTRDNASFFRAIRIEKTMMTLILMLVMAVAAFNTVSALVMVVNEKRNDIAILRTIGITPRAVVGVFVIQGVVIGWVGALLGCGLGLLLAFNAGPIVATLEGWTGRSLFDPTVYYITEVPSEVRALQVVVITAIALLLTVVATIYPALRGAATEPADALRYE
jgi:lipoprotein-releasing system permease protein